MRVLVVVLLVACGRVSFDPHRDAGTPIDGQADAPAPNAVAQVSVGGYYSCARLGSGAVSCWGAGSFGGLGDGTSLDRGTPGPVPLAVPAAKLSTNDAGTCALIADGTAWCWGLNEVGQLGLGQALGAATPRLVPRGDIAEIGLGNQLGCLRTTSGQVACAGRGDLIGGAADHVTFDDINVTDAIGITAGDDFACALRENGSIRCIGKNYSGGFGDGTLNHSVTAVPGAAGPYERISAGDRHVCGIAGGRVECWGEGMRGELGHGSFANSSVPVEVPGITDAIDIATASVNTCVLHATGIVDCFGAEHALGDGSLVDRATPGPVPLDDIVEIDAHTSLHICARRRDGTLWCWGDNNAGQLGTGGLSGAIRTPVMVVGLP